MKKAYLHTFGCKVNQYESQVLRENVGRAGYVFSKDYKTADTVFLNTCTVTHEADRRCRQLIRQISRRNPKAKIVVTGCYAIRSPRELAQISSSVEVAPEKEKIFEKKDFLFKDSAITDFFGHTRAFVKIQDGCDAYCSYCIVPYVRPRMLSKPRNGVINEIKRLLDSGYVEIVLSGVRLGRYKYGLTKLLSELIDIPGKFRIRLSSLEINEVNRELLKLMQVHKDRICCHLHLPLQSGSDSVLRKMNRPYLTDDFSSKLDMARKYLPDAGITTDVIVGFPCETDIDFKKTYDFIKSHKFSRLHVFKFSPRAGTKAFGLHSKVPGKTANERSMILRELDDKLQSKFWRSFIGCTRQVILEKEKNTALTDNYIRLDFVNNSHGSSMHRLGSRSNINSIFTVKITEISGKPSGIRV